jgi:triosephosphate isomerase
MSWKMKRVSEKFRGLHVNRPRMFGTNWKMNKNIHEAAQYAETFREKLRQIDGISSAQVFVIPPYTSIAVVRERSCGTFWVGAQNMHWESSGAFTGEISAEMLVELGVDLVQVGHAERRGMFHETDVAVNQKVQAALHAGLRALVCIGEDLEAREFKVEREVCARQLRIALTGVSPSAIDQIVIAYEPAWAIGENGTKADPFYVRDMKDLFRSILKDMFSDDVANNVPILYGGSVIAEEASRLLLESQADGLFVGRAALDPVAFAALISSCL